MRSYKSYLIYQRKIKKIPSVVEGTGINHNLYMGPLRLRACEQTKGAPLRAPPYKIPSSLKL